MRIKFRRLFEDTKITTRFLKRQICNTVKIHALFAIFNSKEFAIQKFYLTIIYLPLLIQDGFF